MASLENMDTAARDELAGLMSDLADNPATRKELLRLTKKVRPGMSIPELDMEDQSYAVLEHANTRINQLEGKLAERDSLEKLNDRRASLMKKGLIDSEDEIDAVERIMLDKGITSHESAAEFHKYMKQSAIPTPSNRFTTQAVGMGELSNFFSNPKQAALDEAVKAMQDFRRPNGNRPHGL